MKRQLLYRPEALDDLNGVERYTRQSWDEPQAKRYVAALVSDIRALQVSALSYPLHDDVFPGLRRKRGGMHHIYFVASPDSVEVLKIIHTQRDPGLHLKVETWREEDEMS